MAKKKNPIKWKRLTHNGPAFPPPYKRLPVKILYGRKSLKLSSQAEEAAVLYAKSLRADTKLAKDRTFINNFLEDFTELLSAKDREMVVSPRLLNFRKVARYLSKVEKAKKPRKENQNQKRKAERLKKKHGTCRVDGKIQPIANFMVEPPAIFRGRGDHPRRGRIKLRITPQDVTINCSKGCKVLAPGNARWQNVIHDQQASWLAKYKNSLGDTKYVMLGQSSNIKATSDREKYEAARNLGKSIKRIRSSYTKDFESKDEKKRQTAVALYFIDHFALRIGNEKREDAAADTVGCCTLRKSNVTIKGRDKIILEFRGKDTIKYKKEHTVTPKIVNLLKEFKKNKSRSLFDATSAHDLNEYLKRLAPARLTLTAKTFRTYHASSLLQKELKKTPKPNATSLGILLGIFAEANLRVAQLCNHKKAVPKNHQKVLTNLKAKIAASDTKLRLLKSKLNSLRSRREKMETVLNQIQKERESNINLKTKLKFATEGKEFALNTAKQNYIDPRITMTWCRKCNVPYNKVFSKAMLRKFQWAVDEIESKRTRFVF